MATASELLVTHPREATDRKPRPRLRAAVGATVTAVLFRFPHRPAAALAREPEAPKPPARLFLFRRQLCGDYALTAEPSGGNLPAPAAWGGWSFVLDLAPGELRFAFDTAGASAVVGRDGYALLYPSYLSEESESAM